MAFTKSLHSSGPTHHILDTKAAEWVMIVILLGLTCYVFASLLDKVAG
ncbi:MAG: hypothetical protein ABI693_20225 [Bryobacteraceae bacterium]